MGPSGNLLADRELPFAVEDRVDRPVSFYAATKRCGELMSFTYSHLYGLAVTGLRFFTVYGPWGRPDMAANLFTRAILMGSKRGQVLTIINLSRRSAPFPVKMIIVKT